MKDWQEKLKNELIDKVDEYFPKIKPLGINKGRGEAMVIVGIALARFEQLLDNQKKEMIERIEEHRQDEGGRQSREQTNTWYENSLSNEVYNQALDDIIQAIK